MNPFNSPPGSPAQSQPQIVHEDPSFPAKALFASPRGTVVTLDTAFLAPGSCNRTSVYPRSVMIASDLPIVGIFTKVPHLQYYYNTGCLDEES